MTAQSEKSADELRRERRRQKILNRSEDRMKKITGVEQREGSLESDCPSASKETTEECITEESIHTSSAVHQRIQRQERDHSTTRESSQESISNQEQVTSSRASTDPSSSRTVENGLPDNVKRFCRARCLISILLGIIVRISFCFSFGEDYVQNMFNPFTAWEIAAFGYQHAMGISARETVKKDVMIQLLSLTGTNRQHIDTYQSIMAVVSILATDFAFYFFAFIATHLFL